MILGMDNVMTMFRVKLGLKRDGKQKASLITIEIQTEPSGNQREPLALFSSDLQLDAFMPVP